MHRACTCAGESRIERTNAGPVIPQQHFLDRYIHMTPTRKQDSSEGSVTPGSPHLRWLKLSNVQKPVPRSVLQDSYA